MISVVIATLNSERPLLATLAALVPGAVDGLISEVIVADGGSRDDTALVADAAGCKFLVSEEPLARRLKRAAEAARAPWLLFLRPGTVPDAAWTGEAWRFFERAPTRTGFAAAAFRRDTPPGARLRDVTSLLLAALGAPPRPQQGLFIAHAFYDSLGGHAEAAADAEADLIRRIGARRIAILAVSAFQQFT
jgi:cellulose synthase/poly-beta-1,6-N-acetylglucosamine synthase-like glycosyltransferase